MPDQLKSKTLHGLFWSFFERIGYIGAQFVVSIILARLLLPEQFGLIAMLTIFIMIAQTFLDSGFGLALIQKQDATHIDESSIFYFNILVGVIATGLLFLAAPFIAAFYKTPVLVMLTRVLSLNLVINSFGLVQTALLTKSVDFKTQMKVSTLSVSLAGIISVAMALKGFGVWALVAQSLINNIFRTALLWFFSKWRPLMAFSYISLKSMFPFGSKLLFSSLLGTIFGNMYLIVIGKIYSATDLGLYSQANRLQQVIVGNISVTASRVSFPVFATMQENKVRLKRSLRKALTTMSLVNFPLMIVLAVVARPLILVLVTDKWLPCVSYLQLLCVVGVLYPLHAINLNVLKAQGRSDLTFKLEVLKKIVALVAIAITYRWGIMVMIYGQVATSCICYYFNAYYTGKLLKYPIGEQIMDVLPTLGLAVVMGVGVYGLGLIPVSGAAVQLTLQIVAGALLYIALCYLFKLESFREVVELVKPRFVKYFGIG